MPFEGFHVNSHFPFTVLNLHSSRWVAPKLNIISQCQFLSRPSPRSWAAGCSGRLFVSCCLQVRWSVMLEITIVIVNHDFFGHMRMMIGSSFLVFLFKVQRWMLACLTSIFSWAKFTLIWHVVGIWANLSSACPVHFKSWIQGVCWKKTFQ